VALGKWPVRLVILDSVAAAFRAEAYGLEAAGVRAQAARSTALLTLGAHLHTLAATRDVGVVVINQASDEVDGGSGGATVRSLPLPPPGVGRHATISVGSRRLRPALGLAWDTVVTTRFMMANPRTTQLPHALPTVAVQPLLYHRTAAAGDTGGAVEWVALRAPTAEPALPGKGAAWSAGAAAVTPAAVRYCHLLRSPCTPHRQTAFFLTDAGLASATG
jgi:hypothetical protein